MLSPAIFPSSSLGNSIRWSTDRPPIQEHFPMKIDWNRVKQQTLWSYEDLIKKLLSVLAYDFVQEHYDHTMKQAQAYAKKIRRGYLQNQGDMTVYIDNIVTNLETLETLRIGTYSKLVHQIATREQCVAFLQRTDFDFDQLTQTLN